MKTNPNKEKQVKQLFSKANHALDKIFIFTFYVEQGEKSRDQIKAEFDFIDQLQKKYFEIMK